MGAHIPRFRRGAQSPLSEGRHPLWQQRPDPAGRDQVLRHQLVGTAKLHGGEESIFTSKRDNRVWQIDLRNEQISELFEWRLEHHNPGADQVT